MTLIVKDPVSVDGFPQPVLANSIGTEVFTFSLAFIAKARTACHNAGEKMNGRLLL
jgi:hypothetical protein